MLFLMLARRRPGLATALAMGAAIWNLVRWLREADLRGHVALITGGSQGLGLLIARELAGEGCRLVICARDEDDLERAKHDLESRGAEVLAVPCDVGDERQVQHLVDEAMRRYGHIDVLVNNAGIIQVGPVELMTVEDFERSMATMFWGVLYPTLAVLPQMIERRAGRIVNITSIGGKVSVPHLLPYNSAKFAATGLSEGLRAELARHGVTVTTIAPGLMRTGSHLNAWFKAGDWREFAMFAPLASLPVFSMDAERAARQIVTAAKRGDAEHTLSVPATLLARFHGLFPGLTADIFGLVNRLLPQAPDEHVAGRDSAHYQERGREVRERIDSRIFEKLTAWGESAARRFNQPVAPRAERAGERHEPQTA